MGQRHQIYIRIANPLKKEELRGAIHKANVKDNKEAELYFGKGKYSVIPFHHQWLYGATAVGMLVNIMKKVHEAKGDTHPFSPDLTQIPYADHRTEKQAGYGLIEFIKALISITDFEVSQISGRFGIERLTYIGDEHYDYETKKSDKYSHQKSCDNGDNNDGIMIIDVPSKKYCFMNIYEQDKEYCSAGYLPQLEPCHAMHYFEAYYPLVKRDDETKETLAENKEIAGELTEIVKDFDVLSLAEVKKMFPQTYRDFEKTKARKLAEKK